MRHLYGEDLAYIHDVGFGGFAAGAAPGILGLLGRCGVKTGLVVDLGCGSGVFAEALLRFNYTVMGVDASAAMIRLARHRVPEGKFVRRSLQTVVLPACAAVTAIGEALNYLPAPGADVDLDAVFLRVFTALHPGGVFIFDIAETRLALAEHETRSFAAGRDWAVVVEKRADPSLRLLERRIVSFRRIGKMYRRNEEIHQLQLYERGEIMSLLTQAGFHARVLSSYGKQRIPPGRSGFLAVKPGR